MNKKQSKLTSLWQGSDDDCIILDPLPLSSSLMNQADVPLVTVSSCKKAATWVSSSFDGFSDFNKSNSGKSRNISRKQASSSQTAASSLHASHKNLYHGKESTGNVTIRANTQPENELWSEKYSPKVQADLAVHKKKIQEVEKWIIDHTDKTKHLPPILLLTGPAGVGKTATIRVLAQELPCEIHEWVNPLSGDSFENSWSNEDWKYRSRVEMGISGSQLTQFQDFLLRANKYNTLDIFGGGGITTQNKLILIEDFPNMFFRDTASFHDILRKYLKIGGSPLVFIVTDSTSGDSNERLLFPKDLQSQLSIANISFNPVAVTSMTKILTKIVTEESLHGRHKFSIPSKSMIESIAMSSAGDIRGAINALQFACLKDTCDIVTNVNTNKSSKRTGSTKTKDKSLHKKSQSKSNVMQEDEERMAIGAKDTSLFLFRALGKILYCKRCEPSPNTESSILPEHLSAHYRDPLLVNPEVVVEKSHLSGDFFGAYLHQNYLAFFSTIEEVVTASEYLSDADYITIDWASRSVLQHYTASVVTRGIIFANASRGRHTEGGGTSLGWKPLHKPQWYTTSKLSRENCDTARFIFKGYRSSPVVLQTEIIPYISVINTTLHDPGQISFMQEICRFSNQRKYERLDENEIEVDSDHEDAKVVAKNIEKLATSVSPVETEDITSSQSNVKSSQGDENDYLIEDFDD